MKNADEKMPEGVEEALEVADPNKRELMKRLVTGAAFALPVVASFAVSDMASAQPNSFITTTVTRTVA